MKKIITIKNNPSLAGMAEVFHEVVFSAPNGVPLTAEVVLPWIDWESGTDNRRFPFILFIQGSGWTFPSPWYQLPQLSALAAKGYVIASITHRNSLEGNPYPACIEDVKAALSFFKSHAVEYAIDTEHIGMWGTSSGANLSMIIAMTEDIPIKFVVSCFATTDMPELYLDANLDSNIRDAFTALSGGNVDEDMAILKKMSPYYLIEEGKTYPPMFISHGTEDMLIPYIQSEKFYHKLTSCTDTDAIMVAVENAPHEGAFFSAELMDMIHEFIQKYI